MEWSRQFLADLPATLLVAGLVCSLVAALMTVPARRDLWARVELLDALVDVFLLLLRPILF